MPAIMEASQKMQAKLVEFHQTRASAEAPEAEPEKLQLVRHIVTMDSPSCYKTSAQ